MTPPPAGVIVHSATSPKGGRRCLSPARRQGAATHLERLTSRSSRHDRRQLRRTAARFGDRAALADVAPGRVDVPRARGRGGPARPRLLEGGVCQGRPGRHLGAELRRVGDGPVRHRQDRRHPGQHQPGLRTRSWSTRCASPGSASGGGPRVQDLGLRGDDRRGPPALPGPAGEVVLLGSEDWQALGRPGRRPDGAGAAQAALNRTTRSTSSTPRAPPASPRARRCPTTTS